MVFRDYQVLLKRLGFSFLLFLLFRIVFYFYNFNYFKSFPIGETLFAFIYGLRFDLAIVLITNLFFIIGSLIPITHIKYRSFLKVLFVSFNTVFLGCVIVDLEFFTFLGKKMTFDIFDMAGDIQNQIFQLALNYWFLSLPIILNIIVLWKFYPRRRKEVLVERPMKWYKVLGLGLVIFVFTAIGIRGGLQLRSISTKEAFIHNHYELGNLTLNAAYSMVRSIGKKAITKEKFYKTDKEAKNYILNSRNFKNNFSSGLEKQNVIIIIIESFSQEYINKGYAPFFSELAEKSLYYPLNLANGRRSLEALPSIMTGFPSIVGKPIYQSQYQANKYYALPKILKDNGYQTGFFHGGKRGTMDFDAYCFSIGFDHYYALEDYPNQDHYDGHWGVFDHYYLNYFVDEVSKYQEPFFTGVFTLSSHQPYSIPKEFQGKFPKGSLKIHESIGYVDHALKTFFERAQEKPWFKNTLFIITADHTQKLESKEFSNTIGRYRVPLMFYHPQLDLKQERKARLTQQADIMPSVLDFLSIEFDKKLLYGSSVLSNEDGRVINFINGNYFYYKDTFMMRFDKTNANLYRFSENMSILEGVDDQQIYHQMLKELKAYIQYTNNGLRGNNIYDI